MLVSGYADAFDIYFYISYVDVWSISHTFSVLLLQVWYLGLTNLWYL